MLNKLISNLKKITLMDILRLGILSVILLYVFTYIYGFEIWKTIGADPEENWYATYGMYEIIETVGIAFVVCCINYRLTYWENKLSNCLATIIAAISQILILGINGIETSRFNALYMIRNCIRQRELVGTYWAVERLEKAENSVLLVEKALVILIMLSLVISIIIMIRNLFNLKDVFVMTNILRWTNYIMIVLVLLQVVTCAYIGSDAYEFVKTMDFQTHRDFILSRYLNQLFLMIIAMLPVLAILTLIVSRFIKNKKYVMVGLLYASCIIMVKNIIHHAYKYTFDIYEYDMSSLDTYLLLMNIGIVVSVIAVIVEYIINKKKVSVQSLICKLKELTPVDILRLGVLSVILLYVFTYLYGFGIWETIKANPEEDWCVTQGMYETIEIVGIAFVVCCINYVITYWENKIATCLATIIAAISQILILGIDGINTSRFNAIYAIKGFIGQTEQWAVELIERTENCVFLVELALMILIAVSLAIAIIIMMRTISNLKNTFIMTNVFRWTNYIMVIIVLLYVVTCAYICSDKSEYINKFLLMIIAMLPVLAILTLIVSKFIETKKYAMVTLLYVCCIILVNNITHHAYKYEFDFYTHDMSILNLYLLMMNIGIVVAIIAVIYERIMNKKKASEQSFILK